MQYMSLGKPENLFFLINSIGGVILNIPISVQLYTLREDIGKDFTGTLEKVAKIGYKGVEFAGFGNLTSPQLKACLDRLGLKASGSHTGIDDLENNFDNVKQLIKSKSYVLDTTSFRNQYKFMIFTEWGHSYNDSYFDNNLKILRFLNYLE